MCRPLFCILIAIAILVASDQTSAQDKKEQPVIKLASPLGILPGTASPLVVRGFKLGNVTELRFLDLKSAAVVNIKSKGTVKVPDKVPPEKVGDSQIEMELSLPADVPPGIVRFVVVSPQGQSEPHQLIVLDPTKTITEKEPNDGFSTAQEIGFGQTIVGTLSPGQNVDVFRIAGKSGQKLIIEAQAARFGSVLDPFLMLHNAQGQLLAEIDDGPDGADPVLEFLIPTDGVYYVSLLDAHDKESVVHIYVLTIK